MKKLCLLLLLLFPVLFPGFAFSAGTNIIPGEINEVQKLRYINRTTLTVASDTITVSRSYHKVTVQTGASDNLVTINGGVTGQVLTLEATDPAKPIYLLRTGNIQGDADSVLAYGSVTMTYNGSKWVLPKVGTSGGAGDVATDTIWAAAGDIAVGTGNDAAGIVSKGDPGTVLTSGAVTVGWAAPAALDDELAILAALTFVDASIIQLTSANTAAVLTSPGNNYFLKSTSDNSAIEFATPGNALTAIGGQASDAELGILAGLTFADASIIQLTAANSAAVLTSGGNNYYLKSTSDNSALEFAALPVPTTVTVAATADTTSSVALFESASGDLAPKTDPGITYNADTNALTLTGTVTAAGFQSTKADGVAGDDGLYEANSTDTGAAGWRGPSSLAANKSYRGVFPTDRATSANMVLAWTNAGEAGDGGDATPWAQNMSFVDLDLYAPIAAPVFTTSIEAPYLILGSAATAADSGAVRMANNTALAWEPSSAGTDIFIALDGSDILQVGQNAAAIYLGTSGTGNVTVTGDLTVTGSDATLGTGMKITGGAGVATFTDLAGTSEVLAIDLRTENTAKLTTSSGVTTIDAGALIFLTTGAIHGGIEVIGDDTSLSAAQCYGSFNDTNGAETITLPAAVVGMNVLIYSNDATVKTIDPNGTEVIELNGTALTGGYAIKSPGAVGNFITLICRSAGVWTTLGQSGVWVTNGS